LPGDLVLSDVFLIGDLPLSDFFPSDFFVGETDLSIFLIPDLSDFLVGDLDPSFFFLRDLLSSFGGFPDPFSPLLGLSSTLSELGLLSELS